MRSKLRPADYPWSALPSVLSWMAAFEGDAAPCGIAFNAGNVYERLYLRRTGTVWKVVRWEEESFATTPLISMSGALGEIMRFWSPT